MFKNLIWLAALNATLLSGCYGTSLNTGSGSINVGDTTAQYYISRDGGMLLVIWIKHPPGVGHGGGTGVSSSSSKTVLTGNYRSGNVAPLEWRCDTVDGKSGSVMVGGANYELGKGGIFLVDMQGDKPVVTQLSRDMSKLKTKAELEALATTDPEVATFVSDKKKENQKEVAP